MDYLIYSIEDDKDISHLINVALSKQGFEIVSFFEAESFYKAISDRVPNMILLDLMLPNISGFEILKNIRENSDYDDVEIIIISAKSMIMDKVDGLDLGADDYIEKPFNVLELISRVNAKARRYNKNKVLKIDNIVLDLGKHICLKDGVNISLTNKEFEIFSLLIKAKGNVLTREEILNKIWGIDAIYETRTVDMHIKSLRKKIDDNNNIIITIHGIGYKINI